MFQHHGGAHTSNSHRLDAEFIYHPSRESTASEIVSRCNRNKISLDPPRFNLSRKDITDVKESPTGSICCCSMSCSCKDTSNEPGCSSGKWSTWEKYRQDSSSELFSAAIILSAMADCSNNGKIRLPKTPSMKTIRARKSPHLVDKQDGFSTDARREDLLVKRRADLLQHTSRCSSTPLGAASFQVRKMPAKPPSAASGGSYIKDWIRSKKKKL
ncbi:hypothetical protein HPP92_023631 [Vanilla planifolia]|uniref:Uncharacterized protein n=2 Tax=Vanilla planifolia TaxID=51239 RepID=A0A835UC69_VANPL|nr:hypothetical protein HPP92_023631 [Vanilla planifolia]